MAPKKKYAKSDALAREVQCYPAPKYFTLVKGYAALNEASRSETASLAIKCFFDQMPAEERERYINAAQNYPTKKNVSKNSY